MAYTIRLLLLEYSGGDAEISIESFNFGLQNTASTGTTGSGAGAGKVDFLPFAITKTLDADSSLLFEAQSAGKVFRQATLAFSTAGNPKVILARFEFKLVAISQITYSGTGHGGTFPTEQVLFEYGALEFRYNPARHL